MFAKIALAPFVALATLAFAFDRDLAAQCAPNAYNCSPATITTTPNPSGVGQVVTFKAEFSLVAPRNLKGVMRWYVDGQVLADAPVTAKSQMNVEWVSLLQSSALVLTGPAPQSKAITCDYVGTEQYDSSDLPSPPYQVQVKGGPYNHVLQTGRGGGGGGGATFSVTTTVSQPSIVFGERQIIRSTWHAPDYDTQPLTGTFTLLNGADVLDHPPMYNFGEDYSATFVSNALGLGHYEITPSYLGFEGTVVPAAGSSSTFDVVPPRLPTGVEISTKSDVVPRWKPLVVRVSVTRLSGIIDKVPTGTFHVTCAALALDATRALDADGSARLVLKSLPPGPLMIDATYSGDANFQSSVGSRLILAVPKHARFGKPKNASGLSLDLQLNEYRNPKSKPHAPGVDPGLSFVVTARAPVAGQTGASGSIRAKLNGVVIGQAAFDGQATDAQRLAFGPIHLSNGNYRFEVEYSNDAVHGDGRFGRARLKATDSGLRVHWLGRHKTLENTPTEILLGPQPASPIAMAPLFLRAGIKADPNAGGVPAGFVEFREGGELLGRAAVNGASATLHLENGLTSGDHSITASYFADNGSKKPSRAVSRAISVRAAPSLTLATSGKTSAASGSTIPLTAYVYDPNLQSAPVDGTVTFFDPDGVAIAAAPIVNGKATAQWTSKHCVFDGDACMLQPFEPGTYSLRAVYGGNDFYAPSAWTFTQDLVQPDDRTVVQYAMMRILEMTMQMEDTNTQLPNGVLSPKVTDMVKPHRFGEAYDASTPPNELHATGTTHVAQLLHDEFGLDLVMARYRLEKTTADHVDLYGQLSQLPPIGSYPHEVTFQFRSSFIVAKNDDVLVIAFRGTDGDPNSHVNDEGDPALWPLAPSGRYVYAHPGWAWMADVLMDGIPAGQDAKGLGFAGIRQIVQQNRMGPGNKPRALYLAGFSLGGALAQHVALKLGTDGLLASKDRIFTFAAPHIGARNDWVVQIADLLPGWIDEKLGLDGDAITNAAAVSLLHVYSQIVGGAHAFTVALEGSPDHIPGYPDQVAEREWNEKAVFNPVIKEINDWLYEHLKDSVLEDIGEGILDLFGIETVDDPEFIPEVPRPVGYSPTAFGSQFPMHVSHGYEQNTDDPYAFHSPLEYTRCLVERLRASDQAFFFVQGEVRKPLQVKRLQ